MARTYSFAEKKRIRKSFEKISSVMSLPDILEIQTDSYSFDVIDVLLIIQALQKQTHDIGCLLFSQKYNSKKQFSHFFR